MKILGISGGMRNGSNDGMCIEALMGAKEMGAEVEFIQLQNLHIEHCTGCTACVQSVLGGRGGKCVLKDDFDWLLDKMLDAGLLDEAKLVYDHRQTYRTAAQAIGYKEFFPYFEGTATLDACTEKLKQASRNYAKRQLTWFRHMDGVVWLDASAPDVTARAVQLTREFLAKG